MSDSVFVVGSAVEVWSNSRKVWFVGRVEEVADAAGSNNPLVSDGSLKVRFGKKLEKWVQPKDFGRVLRRHVPRATIRDPDAPPASLIRILRQRYYKPDREKAAPGIFGMGGDDERALSTNDVSNLWAEAVKEDRGYDVDSSEIEVIRNKLKKTFRKIRSLYSGRVTVDEWLHHLLLLWHPPGRSVEEAIEKELANSRSSTLAQLVSLWMRLDRAGTGCVDVSEFAEALKEAGVRAWQCDDEAKLMVHDMDGDGCAFTYYCDFAAKFLRLEYVEVCLFWYDLSGGWSKYMSPLVLWSQEGGIWHTGLVVFGQEFYYAGRIFRGHPGGTPFGTPTKIQRLGLTLRTAKEFESHLVKDMDRVFTEANYDVLEHNCNNFTDQAAVFLLGQQIPEEIRLQPARAMGAPMVRMFRPLLNKWLGRVEGEELDISTEAAGIEHVSYQPKGRNKTVVAQVLRRYRDGSCDIRWFERGDSQGREAKKVPQSELSEVQSEDANCCIT